ncbi:MAG: 6-pyruvoyltetrahydropterin synthase, partial [Bacteroidota bacterium]
KHKFTQIPGRFINFVQLLELCYCFPRVPPQKLKTMVYVIRKEHFNAAHRLFNPAWSEEKNHEVFGPCANNNWHGHNFELIVTVKGIPDTDTGFVYDLKQLGDLIKAEIIDKVDHKNLNLDVDFMLGKLASCEILVMEFWKILAPKIKETSDTATLHKIHLIETNKNSVEYFGE